MACDAEDCGFQILNDDEIVTSVQEESDPVDDETDEDANNTTKVARVHQMLTRFQRLNTIRKTPPGLDCSTVFSDDFIVVDDDVCTAPIMVGGRHGISRKYQ
ncbi:hypothetical protein TNCV_4705501 [Trichonephila clavipes]|nr:hypothetical protein TNCV_4705501 [Trichonephila clavipes]